MFSCEVTEFQAKVYRAASRIPAGKVTTYRLMARVIGMLTPSQSERLKQIQLQQAIASTLVKPEFVKALNISKEQLERIRPLSDRIGEKQSAKLHELDGLTREERRKKFMELTKEQDKAQAEANKLALDVLTPEQRAKLEEFTGQEIEVTWDYDALAPAMVFP